MLQRNTIEGFYNNYEPITEVGCWIWTGNISTSNGCERGYCMVDGRREYAYRVSYRIFKGEIPEGMQVNHHCDVPLCVNPDHLYAGTHQNNVDDMMRRRRRFDNSGEKNGKAKLNAEKVKEIIASTEKNADIARKYGVTEVSISCIKNGKRWKHIHRPINHSAI